MSTRITKRQAQALFDQLATAIANLDQIILEIATTKAWAVAGYASLGEALDATLPASLPRRGAWMQNIVTLLLANDVPSTEVQTLSGVGPTSIIEGLRAAGKMPAPMPRTTGPVSRPYTVAFEVSAEEHDHWVAVAKARGTSLRSVALEATRAEFARLGESRRAVA